MKFRQWSRIALVVLALLTLLCASAYAAIVPGISALKNECVTCESVDISICLPNYADYDRVSLRVVSGNELSYRAVAFEESIIGTAVFSAINSGTYVLDVVAWDSNGNVCKIEAIDSIEINVTAAYAFDEPNIEVPYFTGEGGSFDLAYSFSCDPGAVEFTIERETINGRQMVDRFSPKGKDGTPTYEGLGVGIYYVGYTFSQLNYEGLRGEKTVIIRDYESDRAALVYSGDSTRPVNDEAEFVVRVPDDAQFFRIYMNNGWYYEFRNDIGEEETLNVTLPFTGTQQIFLCSFAEEEVFIAPQVIDINVVSYGDAVLPEFTVLSDDITFGDTITVEVTPAEGCGAQNYSISLVPDADGWNGRISEVNVYDQGEESFTVELSTLGSSSGDSRYYDLRDGGTARVLVAAYAVGYEFVETEPAQVTVDPIEGSYLIVTPGEVETHESFTVLGYLEDYEGTDTEYRLLLVNKGDLFDRMDGWNSRSEDGRYTENLSIDRAGTYTCELQVSEGEDRWVTFLENEVTVTSEGAVDIDRFTVDPLIEPGSDIEIGMHTQTEGAEFGLRIVDMTYEQTIFSQDDICPEDITITEDELVTYEWNVEEQREVEVRHQLILNHHYRVTLSGWKSGLDTCELSRYFICKGTATEHSGRLYADSDYEDGSARVNENTSIHYYAPDASAVYVYEVTEDWMCEEQFRDENERNLIHNSTIWMNNTGEHALILFAYYGDLEDFDPDDRGFSQYELIDMLYVDCVSDGYGGKPTITIQDSVERGNELEISVSPEEDSSPDLYQLRVLDDDLQEVLFREIPTDPGDGFYLTLSTFMFEEGKYYVDVRAGSHGWTWGEATATFTVYGDEEAGNLFYAEKELILTNENVGLYISLTDPSMYENAMIRISADGMEPWDYDLWQLRDNGGFCFWDCFSPSDPGEYTFRLGMMIDDEWFDIGFEPIVVTAEAYFEFDEPEIITDSYYEKDTDLEFNYRLDGNFSRAHFVIDVETESERFKLYEKYCGRDSGCPLIIPEECIPDDAKMLYISLEMCGYGYYSYWKEIQIPVVDRVDEDLSLRFADTDDTYLEAPCYSEVDLLFSTSTMCDYVEILWGDRIERFECERDENNPARINIEEGEYQLTLIGYLNEGEDTICVACRDRLTVDGVSYEDAVLPMIETPETVDFGDYVQVELTPAEGSGEQCYNVMLSTPGGWVVSDQYITLYEGETETVSLYTAAMNSEAEMKLADLGEAVVTVRAWATGKARVSESTTIDITHEGSVPYISAQSESVACSPFVITAYLGEYSEYEARVAYASVSTPYDEQAINMNRPDDGDFLYGEYEISESGIYALRLQVLVDEEWQTIAQIRFELSTWGTLSAPLIDMPAIVRLDDDTGGDFEVEITFDEASEYNTLIMYDVADEDNVIHIEITESCEFNLDRSLITEGHRYCLHATSWAPGHDTVESSVYFIVTAADTHEGSLNLEYGEQLYVWNTYTLSGQVTDTDTAIIYDFGEDNWIDLELDDDGNFRIDTGFAFPGIHTLVLMGCYGDTEPSDINNYEPIGNQLTFMVLSDGKVTDQNIYAAEIINPGDKLELSLGQEDGRWANRYRINICDEDYSYVYYAEREATDNWTNIALPAYILEPGHSYIVQIDAISEGVEARYVEHHFYIEDGAYTPADRLEAEKTKLATNEHTTVSVYLPDYDQYTEDGTEIWLRFDKDGEFWSEENIGDRSDFDGYAEYEFCVGTSGEYTVRLQCHDAEGNVYDLDTVEPLVITVEAWGEFEDAVIDMPVTVTYGEDFTFSYELDIDQDGAYAYYYITTVPDDNCDEWITILGAGINDTEGSISIPTDYFSPNRCYSLGVVQAGNGYNNSEFYRFFYVVTEPEEGLSLHFAGTEETWLTAPANTKVYLSISVPEGYDFARIFINDYYHDCYFEEGSHSDDSYFEYFNEGYHAISMRAYSKEKGWSALAPQILNVVAEASTQAQLPETVIPASACYGDPIIVKLTTPEGAGTQTYNVVMYYNDDPVCEGWAQDVAEGDTVQLSLDTDLWNSTEQCFVYPSDGNAYIEVRAVAEGKTWNYADKVAVEIKNTAADRVIGTCKIHLVKEIVAIGDSVIQLPANLTTIGEEAFADITVDTVIASARVKSIAAGAFDGADVHVLIIPDTCKLADDIGSVEHIIVRDN